MEQIKLGATGLSVSRLAFGFSSYGSTDWMPWALSESEALSHLKRALDLGFTFIDTADSYSSGLSETFLGRSLAALGVPRSRIVIGTKVFGPMGPGANERGLSRKHIRHAIDDSLRRLGTDYVDLYQIHRLDPSTPIDEILEALDDVVRAGKALHLGASTMHAWQFAKLQHRADTLGLTRFVSMQNRYNLLYREEERETIPLCVDQGVAIVPYSPLARGLLTGSRGRNTARSKVVRDFARPEDDAVVARVQQVAAQRGVSAAEVALAWLLHKPGVTAPIVGATRLEHLDAAAAAATLNLSVEEIAALEAPYVPQQVLFERDAAPVPGRTAASPPAPTAKW